MQWLVFAWGTVLLCSVALTIATPRIQSLRSFIILHSVTWFFSEFALQWAVFHLGVNTIFFAFGIVETQIAWSGILLSFTGYYATGIRLNRLTELRFYAQQQLKSVLGHRYELDIHLDMRQRLTPLPVNWNSLWNPQKLFEQVQVQRNVEFCQNPSLLMDIYEPVTPIFKKAPVLMELHGGAWYLGSRHQRQPFLCRMARQGWKCFSISYQLMPDACFPAPILDCKRAIAHIRENAEHYQIDPDFIVLSGGSSGASIASLAALTPKEIYDGDELKNHNLTVQGCVSWYGIYDMQNQYPVLAQILEKFCPDSSKMSDVSPIMNIGKDAPPFLVIQGSADMLTSLESAKEFYYQLTQAQIPNTAMIALPLAGHLFDATHSVTAQCSFPAVERYLAFLFSKYLTQIN